MPTYKVPNLTKVDTTRYKEGDLFFTDKQIGMLIGGSIKRFQMNAPNLKDYVKKEDVQKMIEDALKKEGDNK